MFFFIVNQGCTELVLDITISKKGGKLVVELAHGGPNQLWRWDEDCRLVSKSGLVADIKGKSKKVGAVCHAWIPHNGLNQKWRVEEGAIKSNLNGLVIDATSQPVSMREHSDTACPSQKWYFIPENAWSDFQLVQADPNPLNKAQFWKHLADSYLDVIIGYNIEDYEDKVHKACEIMDECASKLNQVATGTGIAKTVGGSAQIVGGGLAIAGLALAPVTAGASVGLTIAGITTGVAGGVTSFGSSVVNQICDKRKKEEITKATAPLFRATLSLKGFLNEYINLLNEATDFLKTPAGEAVAKDACAHVKLATKAGQAVWHSYRVGDTIYTGVKHLTEAKRIKALVTLIQADYYVVNEAKVALATQAAAPGVKLFGKTIIAAGTVGAKALSGSLAGFGILFGFWDIFGGAKKIKNGSELVEEFHKSSEVLRAESSELIRLYKELQ